MNFEFPIKELPAVMRGPRVERRRVLVGGSAYWGTMVDDGADAGKLRLDDGRLLPTTSTSQYAATLGTWFGVPTNLLGDALPYINNFSVRDLGLFS